MSSPGSGPYRSRVLNLILQNYRTFIDSCGSALRQVQFSTSTTLQTAIFSVYSLFKRLVGEKKRLNSAEPQTQPLDQAAEPQKQLGSVDQPILDIVAIAQEEIHQASGLTTDPTVKAIATQLETKKLVLVGEDNQVLDILSWRQRRVLRRYIYRGAVHLPAGTDSSAQTAVSNAITLAQKSTIAVAQTSKELGITLAQAWKTNSKDLTVHSPENNSLNQVQAVIWAAIDYFFFKDHNQQLNAGFQAEAILSGKPQPQKLTPQPEAVLNKKPQPQPPKSPRIIYYPIQTNTESTSPPRSEQPLKFELTKVEKCDNEIGFEKEPSANNDEYNVASECLQAEATAVGYVKHPLERILEWLDRVLFWLEETLIKAWNWIKQKWATD
ncbi:MAG: hypothetical protein AAFO04_14570 [Cyanobacteria bacterium J06592_8]